MVFVGALLSHKDSAPMLYTFYIVANITWLGIVLGMRVFTEFTIFAISFVHNLQAPDFNAYIIAAILQTVNVFWSKSAVVVDLQCVIVEVLYLLHLQFLFQIITEVQTISSLTNKRSSFVRYFIHAYFYFVFYFSNSLILSCNNPLNVKCS